MKLINKEIILKKIKSIFLLIATFFAQIKLFFKKNKRILLSFIHAFWMITLMLFWVRQPFIFDYEFEICKDLIDIETVIRLGNTQGQKEYQNKFNEAKSFYPFNNWRESYNHGLEQYTQENCDKAKKKTQAVAKAT